MTIESVKMQSLSEELGEYAAARFCAPLCFYMLLRATGYAPKKLMPEKFCADLNGGSLKTETADWSRPALTRIFRHKYNAPIVSWQLEGDADIEAMKRAGYLESQQEIDFFYRHIFGKTVKQIVQSGYPVIVTMEPGFGTHENTNIHAVLIAGWKEGDVTIFDPDARNGRMIFDAEHVNKFISRKGGGSVVLPKS